MKIYRWLCNVNKYTIKKIKKFIEVTDDVFEELKGSFMEVYDDNKDGKIDIREMAQLLPMEENFLLLFRFDNPLESSVEFMKVQTTNTNINLFKPEI